MVKTNKFNISSLENYQDQSIPKQAKDYCLGILMRGGWRWITKNISPERKDYLLNWDQFCYILEKVMAPHSSTLAWKIPWTKEPDGLQSMGSWRVGHDWVTSLSLFTFMHWRRKWQPTRCSCLENPRDRGAWWAAIYGVAQSRTRLKRLSSSSRPIFSTLISSSEFYSFSYIDLVLFS